MLDAWLRRSAGSPVDMALKTKLKKLLGDVALGSRAGIADRRLARLTPAVGVIRI
jgi:hypothetical protein